MKYYKWDENSLMFVAIKHYYKCIIVFLLMGIMILTGLIISAKLEKKLIYSEIRYILLKEQTFSEDKLVRLIEKLNFQFPEIVYAQAILETNHFKSRIFIENNNCFGMKKACQRINIATGSQYDHAYYLSWKESVYDYALYAASYMSKLDDSEHYFQYLAQSYAEDTFYIKKLRIIIEQEHLKTKFKIQ